MMACMPRVIHKDAELLILYKPAGLIVHSDGRTIEPSVAEWIAEKYPDMAQVGEPWVSPQGVSIRVCGLVHRLDRSTTGVLIAACTPDMYAYLKGEFKARRITKTYRALVRGHISHDAGEIVAAIERTTTVPKRWYAVPCERDHVRAAVTPYQVLSRGETADGVQYTYVELSPKTGRTHQIRVHMAHMGHPLFGDALYGANSPDSNMVSRIALHALSVEFVLPSGTRVRYGAPLPDDMSALLQK